MRGFGNLRGLSIYPIRLRKAAFSEFVGMIIFVAVVAITMTTFGGVLNGLWQGTGGEDTSSINSFNNIADEVSMLIDNERAFAYKADVPLFLSQNFSIVAFNKGDTIARAYLYGYYESPHWYNNEEGSIGDSSYGNVSYMLASLPRPDSCTGSCLCLFKAKKINDILYPTRLFDKMMYYKRKAPGTDTLYYSSEPVCRDFPANVRFYSYSTQREHDFQEFSGKPTTGKWRNAGMEFGGQAIGTEASWVDLKEFQSISFASVSAHEEIGPQSPFMVAKGSCFVSLLNPQVAFFDRLTSFYSNLFLNDITRTSYSVKADSLRQYSVEGRCKPQMADSLQLISAFSDLKNKNLYIDKIDYRKLYSESRGMARDEIYIFIATPESGIYDKRYRPDGTKAEPDATARKEGVVKFGGEYSLIELRKNLLSTINRINPAEVLSGVTGYDDSHTVEAFVRLFTLLENRLVYSEKDEHDALLSLDIAVLLKVRGALKNDPDSLPGQMHNQMLLLVNTIIKEQSLKSPTAELSVVENNAGQLLADGKMKEAYQEYSAFADLHRSEIFDEDGGLADDLLDRYPKLAAFKDALAIKGYDDAGMLSVEKTHLADENNAAMYIVKTPNDETYYVIPSLHTIRKASSDEINMDYIKYENENVAYFSASLFAALEKRGCIVSWDDSIAGAGKVSDALVLADDYSSCRAEETKVENAVKNAGVKP